MSPLPADPARQADAMLRACDYQILQTVSAWLDLRGDEVLHVEGAEDFDKISPTDAESVQVKTSPDPISLGQRAIQETLNNYWKLRGAAAGRAVRMRFLTCAPVTVERGNPFGRGVAGLHVWQRRPLSDDDAGQIGQYLAKQPQIEASLRYWLDRATPTQVRSELVECVTWQCNAEDAHFVERGIYSKLAFFAEKRGAAPASTTKLVALRLNKEVWDTLRNPAPRRLDFFRLEELWEEVTRISVPRSALESRWNEAGILQTMQSTRPSELLKAGIPPLPGAVAHRVKLVGQWRASLSTKGLLNLHGSTRTGKTTLAKLIALPDAEKWRWWSAARMKLEEVEHKLPILVHEVARSPDVIDIIVDDLDFSPAAAQAMEESLGELLAVVGGRRGRVIITSQKPLPGRFQHAFGIEGKQIVMVPRLDDEEVGDLASALGCTDDKQRSAWARLVRASTGGHPQLAAVRLWALRERGWPTFSAETFDSGASEVDAEKADARQLIEGLPKSQQKLLQRLSVFPGIFRRDHAIGLGAVPPSISSPGNVFDPLVGPWVEPLHAGYFALSPLFADGARAALTPEHFKKLQNEAAEVLIKTEPRTTREGASAFMLNWQTRNGGMLVDFLQSVLEMERDIFAAFANDISWFTLVADEQGKILFPDNRLLSLFLRQLQFRVATIAAPERAIRIMDAWRWELMNTTVPDRALQRMMFAGEILSNHRVPLRAGAMIGLLRDIAQAASAHPEMPWPSCADTEELDADTGDLDYLPERNDFVLLTSFLNSTRCTSTEFLDELLTALETTEPDLRGRILIGFGGGGGIGARVAFDQTLFAEADRDVPDWENFLRVFERAFALGQKWESQPLATAAMRGICVVLDEYVKDHRAAHEALDRMSANGKLATYAMHDRRASIFFSETKYAAAEEQWQLALANWPRQLAPFDKGAAFAARSAGISAARQERWIEASNWFKEIIERLPKTNETAFMAGAHADSGYCLWKVGKTSEAIASLIEAWRLVDMLPLGKEDLEAFITRKTVGHVIAWIHGRVTKEWTVNLHEPLAGICSSAERPEKMREFPETDSGIIWLMLMRLERVLNAGIRAAELGRKPGIGTTNPATQSVALVEEITQALAAGNVAIFPAKVIALARAINLAAALAPGPLAAAATCVAPEVFHGAEALRGTPVFLAGLVAANAQGRGWRATLTDWRSSLPKDAGAGWCGWFDNIARILDGSVIDAASLTRRPGDDWAGSMLAAWHLMISEEASPDDVFIAHARWLSEVGVSPWLRETGAAFCQQVEVAWARIILTPALLRQPRLSVPAIRTVCDEEKRDLAKAARILLAAFPAVSTRITSEMEDRIRKLAV